MEPLKDLIASELSLSGLSKDYLRTAAGWAKFLAITGFIFSVLFLIIGFLTTSIQSYNGQRHPEGYNSNLAFLISITFIAIISTVTSIFLILFSNKILRALKQDNQEDLDGAFASLKSMFAFGGMLTIAFLALFIAWIFISSFFNV